MSSRLRRAEVWGMRAALLLLLAAALLLSGLPEAALGHWHVEIERLLGQTPQRRLSSYMAAVSQDSRDRALALWDVGPNPPLGLVERRIRLTDELVVLEGHLEYRVYQVEWWRTCCEPGQVRSGDNAGLARLHAAVTTDADSRVRHYTFDIGTEKPYWGSVGGDPIRRWVLVDVYEDGEEPLGFPWVDANLSDLP